MMRDIYLYLISHLPERSIYLISTIGSERIPRDILHSMCRCIHALFTSGNRGEAQEIAQLAMAARVPH